MKEMGISRRGFLGMGAASLAAAGMASLVGCAPQAKSADDSSKKGDAGAEASADWLGEAPEIAESDIKETIDTEVLCIGAGIAGLITAAHVGEGGARPSSSRNSAIRAPSAPTLAPSIPRFSSLKTSMWTKRVSLMRFSAIAPVRQTDAC